MQCAVFWRTATNAAVMVTVLVAPAACSKSRADRAGPTATVATEPAPTTTTNPYAVPTVIDVAYVNRVLAGLDAAIGDVTRLVVRTKTIPREAYDRLKALYGTNDILQLTVDSIQSDVRRGFAGYKAEPGNRVSTVLQLVSADMKCVFAVIHRDYLAVSINPATINPQWIALRPADASRDPSGYNRTSWSLVLDGFTQDRSAPANPCAA